MTHPLSEIIGILECPLPDIANQLRRAMADDADLQALNDARAYLDRLAARAALASGECLTAIVGRIGPAIEAADLEREKRTNPHWRAIRDNAPFWPNLEQGEV